MASLFPSGGKNGPIFSPWERKLAHFFPLGEKVGHFSPPGGKNGPIFSPRNEKVMQFWALPQGGGKNGPIFSPRGKKWADFGEKTSPKSMAGRKKLFIPRSQGRFFLDSGSVFPPKSQKSAHFFPQRFAPEPKP